VCSRASGGADEPPERSTSTSVGTAPARGLSEHTAATSPAWKGARACRWRANQGARRWRGNQGVPAAREAGAQQRRGQQGRAGGGGSRGVSAGGEAGDSRGAPAAWTAVARRRRGHQGHIVGGGKQGHASVHSLPSRIETQGPAREREVAAGAGARRRGSRGHAAEVGRRGGRRPRPRGFFPFIYFSYKRTFMW
jgi:hypothetical protein